MVQGAALGTSLTVTIILLLVALEKYLIMVTATDTADKVATASGIMAVIILAIMEQQVFA